MRPESVNTALE